MKKLLYSVILLLFSATAFSQSGTFNPITGKTEFIDSIKLRKYGNSGALDSVLTVSPTTKKLMFVRNNGGSPISYPGVDSVKYDTTTKTMCVWSFGIANCFVITTNAPATNTGVDSVVVNGSQLCTYTSGTATCYTVNTTVNNNQYITNYIDSSITINNNPTCSPKVMSGSVVVDSLYVGRNTDIYFQINCVDYFAAASVFNIVSGGGSSFYVGIYADTAGNIGQVVGNTNPLEIPSLLDPQSQILLKVYYIDPATTTPTGSSTTWVYREGDDAYWLDSAGTVTSSYDSVNTLNPFAGVHSLRISAMTAGQYFTWQDGATHSQTEFTDFSAQLRISAVLLKSVKWSITLYNGNSLATSNAVIITDGQYGYSRSAAGGYQFISFPMSQFNFISNTFDKVRITFLGSANVAQQWDDVRFQADALPVNTGNFVESVRGVFGKNVEFAVGDTLLLDGDSTNYLLKDKRTGATLASAASLLTYARYDTCFVIDTLDVRTFAISINPYCRGGGSSTSVASFGKNGTNDSTILVLSDGTRYAAFDRSGAASSGISALGDGYGLLEPDDSTYNVDSSVIATRARLVNELALKLNISDTAAMLSPYKTSYPRQAVSLVFTTTGSSGAATGTYNNGTGVFTFNVPQYSGGGGSSVDTAFSSIAILRAYDATSVTNGTLIELSGYYTPNDGGGGVFVWNSSSTTTDNGGTIIKSTPVTTGRWLRVDNGNTNVFWFGAIPNGSRIVTANLQAALNMTGHVVVPYSPLKFIIDDRLIIKSNTWFDLDPKDTIYEASGNNTVLLRNENIDTTGLTDHDIIVTGGIWNCNWAGNPGTTFYSSYPQLQSDKVSPVRGAAGTIGFFGVTNLTVKGLTLVNGRSFSIQVCRAERVEVGNIHFVRTEATISDGVHFNGPLTNYYIHDITGKTGDDLIALNAWDFLISSPTAGGAGGDIRKGIIERVKPDTSTWGTVKMYTGTSAGVHDLTIRDVKGVSTYSSFPWISGSVELDQQFPSHTTGTGTISGIVLDNIAVGTLGATTGAGGTTYGPAMTIGCNISNLKISNIIIDSTYKPFTNYPWLRQQSNSTITDLTIDGLFQKDSLAWNNLFDFYGSIKRVKISNANFVGSGSLTGNRGNHAVRLMGSDSTNITLDKSTFIGVAGAVDSRTNGNVVNLSSNYFRGTNNAAYVSNSSAKINLTANTFKAIPSGGYIFTSATATSVVNSANNSYDLSGSGVLFKSLGTVRWNGTDLGVDVANLTPVAYDLSKNTNVASAGLGVVQYSGSAWVALGAAPVAGAAGSTTQVQYNNAGALAGSANMVFSSNKFSLPTNNLSDNNFEAGTFGIQSYAVNNGWLSDNIKFDGTNFRHRATGFGVMAYFVSGDFLVQSAISAGGNSVATLTTKLRVYNSGNIVIGTTADNGTDRLQVPGNINLTTAGNKIKIATGTNASVGTATLVGGTVTVSTTAALTASLIYVSVKTPGGTQGFLSVPTITNATSFVINSTSGTETSTVNWWIIN